MADKDPVSRPAPQSAAQPIALRRTNAPGQEYSELAEFQGPLQHTGPARSDGQALSSGLLRHKFLIIGISLAVAVLAIPPIWLLMAPTYKATAVVRISPVLDPIVFNSEKTSVLPFYTSYLNTQVAIIRSPTLLERVLDRPEVRSSQWCKSPQPSWFSNPSTASVDALQKILQVMPRPGTELIDVSVESAKASDAKELVNATVAEYKKVTDETSKASDLNLWETLTRERDKLQMEINGQIETKFNISSQLGTMAPEELRSQYSIQLSNIETERNRVSRELKMLEWQTKGLPGPASQPADAEGIVRRAYAQDGDWRNIDQRIEEARQKLTVAQQEFGELSPQIRNLQLEIEHQQRLLEKRESQIDADWAKSLEHPSSMPEGMTSSVAMGHLLAKKKREFELLEEDVKQQGGKVAQAGQIAQEIARYDEQIREKRDLKEAIRKRLEVLEMEGKAPARVKIAAYALEPSKPDHDRRGLLTIVAAVMAAGLGVGAGYLRTTLDRKIYEISEVQSTCQAPFLGWLPEINSRNLPKELGGSKVTISAALSPGGDYSCFALMEHMRIIRTALLERVSQGGQKVLLVTSSLPCTGKTSVAVLLARSLAVVGKKVLLVEGDLRKPVLAQRLWMDTQPGLAALLCGKIDDASAIRSTGMDRFDVLLAGEIPESFDPEFLANGVFSACVEHWRAAYDFILVDSPPVLPVADAQILATHADGTIMVLKASHDSRREAAEASAQLDAAGGRLLGTVLIGGRSRRRREYAYDYKYSYTYGHYLASGSSLVDKRAEER